MRLHVIPIYGNGWTDGRKTLNEPPPFDVEVGDRDGDTVVGIIVSQGHALNGAEFLASLRYKDDSTTYNCSVLAKNSCLLQGYCMI